MMRRLVSTLLEPCSSLIPLPPLLLLSHHTDLREITAQMETNQAILHEDAWAAVPLSAGAPVDASGATLKSQVAGMLHKLRDSNVAKKAAELMGSNSNSPRSGSGDGTTVSPVASAFGSGSSVQQGSVVGGKQQADGASYVSSCSCSSESSQPAEGSLASSPSTTPQSQQGSVEQQAQQAAQQPAAAGGFNSFSAAKKTIGKIFGAGASAPWSADGSAQPAQGNSPTTGNGLIAAFRSIIPKTSNGSSGEWQSVGCLKLGT